MYDVVLCGYGPAGEIAANLLGQRGHLVLVLEKEGEGVYPLPRAVAMDAEVLRAMQSIDLAEPLAERMRVLAGAEFVNSRGERIQGRDAPPTTPLGWAPSWLFHQPDLDALLRERAATLDTVEVRYGSEVCGVDQHPEHVVVTYQSASDQSASDQSASDQSASETVEVEARYLLACDGAASFVRQTGDFGTEDLGYDQDWLVVDLIASRELDLPDVARQVCDPARRVTYVPGVGSRRRFEFQLLEGDHREQMTRDDTVAELLRPWLDPEDVEVERAAVYRFHALLARSWRRGRVFLLGDAAHQMPPFNGQGLCSGARDAFNLCWKIDLVLRDLASDALLDTYESERRPHAVDTVDHAVMTGRLIDALAEADRGGKAPSDEDLRSGYGGDRRPPSLGNGLFYGDDAAVGRPCPQPYFRGDDGTRRRLDDAMGPGFSILSREPVDDAVSPGAKAFWQRIGGRWLTLPSSACEPDSLEELFARHEAVVVRPDRAVFAATSRAGLDQALQALERGLAAPQAPGQQPAG